MTVPRPLDEARAAGQLPTFLYIGTSKAGSSWLFEILREHPDVFVPVAKDVRFFDRSFERGLSWYRGFFANAGAARAIGELSHDYFHSELYAERIRDTLPDVRLLACLREPGDWAVSRFAYERATSLPASVGFEEFLERPETERQIAYLENLTPFYDRFHADRICVFFFDDLQRDAAGFARDVYEFVGVDPGFEPPSLHRKVLAARRARIGAVGRIAWAGGQVLLALGLVNVIGAAKRHPLFDRLLYTAAERPEVPVGALRRLRARHASTYDALEQLIGRELPAGWRAAAAVEGN